MAFHLFSHAERQLWSSPARAKRRPRCLCLALAIAQCALGASIVKAAPPVPAPGTVKPLDWRHRLETNQWAQSDKNVWTTPLVKAAFPFNELIYYWNVRLPRDEGFRLYLQVEFAPGDSSPWLYAGFWGKVRPAAKRTKPSFDRGLVDEDTLLLKAKASSFRFKLIDEGTAPLTVLPAMGAIASDTNPAPAQASLHRPVESTPPASSRILDIPLRLQVDVCGNPLKDRCQSAALASAMQYFGQTVPLEQIICYTTDPEYESFGIWPRTINAAVEHGFSAYLDRFRDWDAVRRTVAENKVILCSITMPASKEYLAPPYERIGGHIVALCGVAADGRVIVTDSASIAQKAKEGGHCLQWLQPDFEKIWMRNKGGVGMVICPPEGASEKLVSELPDYPRPVPARRAESSGALKALWFSGGGYHDYAQQVPLLTSNLSQQAPVSFDLADTLDRLKKADFAAEYDLIVYDVCFTDIEPPLLENALRTLRDGKPAVMIHCAVHSFRNSPQIRQWEDAIGMRSKVHDPFQAFSTEKLDPEHPILNGFPDRWQTSGDELYQTIEMTADSHPLLKARSPQDGREHIVCWTHSYGKGRVFATSLGHDLHTSTSPDYVRLLSRGVLWACERLNP